MLMVGGVVRDFMGKLTLGWSSKGFVQNAEATEYEAIDFGLQQVAKEGLDCLFVESDASNVVKAINSNLAAVHWSSRSRIEDIRQKLRLFGSVSVIFILKKANSITDWIASFSRRRMYP